MKRPFTRFADAAAYWTGTPRAFIGYVTVVVLWAASGVLLGFSTTWQLLINTPTTVVTVGQLILVAHTQHRDTLALHAKIDELIGATRRARNALVGIETEDEDRIQRIREERA